MQLAGTVNSSRRLSFLKCNNFLKAKTVFGTAGLAL